MKARALAAIAAALLTSGCIWDGLYDETLVGPYRLVAVDDMASMSIMWEIPGGGRVGDGLPGPTVFAAGFDDRYLVAAVHPPVCKPLQADCHDFGMRRDVTEYWYVIRQPDEREHLPYKGIRGPFEKAHFQIVKRALNLPEFRVRFSELE